MGLAPSANGENPGKTALAKVPVPIFSQPRRAPIGERRLDSCATSDERARFRQRTGRSGVELSETKLTVRGMKRRLPKTKCGYVYLQSSCYA
jgi:hypothetical protein